MPIYNINHSKNVKILNNYVPNNLIRNSQQNYWLFWNLFYKVKNIRGWYQQCTTYFDKMTIVC